METALPLILLLPILLFFAIVFRIASKSIRMRYRIWCEREDQLERIDILRRKVLSAKSFIQGRYDTPEDHTVYNDLVPKIDFIDSLIQTHVPDMQEREYQTFLDLLTETFARMERNFDDVHGITSPLNTFRDTLVRGKISELRKIMEN